MKQWKHIDWEDCPSCGHEADVFTHCTELNHAIDGDDIQCGNCGLCGHAVVVEVDEAWIEWDEETETEVGE